MKMIRSAILGVALSLVATAASAALVTETFTGMVTGVDIAGFFGTAGASLNTAFTAQYFYNTSIGSSNNSTGELVQEGSGVSSPSLGANLTINGITYSTNGTDFSLLAAYNSTNPGIPKFLAWTEVDPSVNNFMYNQIQNTSGTGVPFPTSISSPFTYTAQTGDTEDGLFFMGGDALTLTPVTVALTAGVPESSTWVMFLLGFTGVSFTAFRKKLTTVLIASLS